MYVSFDTIENHIADEQLQGYFHQVVLSEEESTLAVWVLDHAFKKMLRLRRLSHNTPIDYTWNVDTNSTIGIRGYGLVRWVASDERAVRITFDSGIELLDVGVHLGNPVRGSRGGADLRDPRSADAREGMSAAAAADLQLFSCHLLLKTS